jgi:ABC-type nitrate/sulfonate/bicarbonate transport system substrate-binding protein
MGVVMKQPKRNSLRHLAVFVTLLWLLLIVQVVSAQTKVKIVDPGAVGSVAFLLPLAHKQGVFAKHGIESHLIFSRGGPALTAILKGGDVQFAYIGAPAALRDISQGADFKILASLSTGRTSNHLVVKHTVHKPEDLRGKRFGVLGIGTGTWINTALALEHLGLDSKRDDIRFLEVGNLTLMAQALEAGKIDAAVLSPAQSSSLKAKGFSVLLDLYAANVYGPQNALAVSRSYLKQNPDVVEKVVAAMVESAAFGLAPKNKFIVLETIMNVFNVTDAATAEEGHKQFSLTVNHKPYPSLERLRDIQRIMIPHYPRVRQLRVEELIEDRFVRKLDDSGFIDRLYSTYGIK